MDEAGPLCLSCADLDHLATSPPATRHSPAAPGRPATSRPWSCASAARGVATSGRGFWSRRRRIERAEHECLADEESRAQRRVREQARRAEEDGELQAQAAREILRLFPGCPRDRAEEIARHAFTRRSGRVGRTAAGRELDREALTLAVVAAVRHVDTPYDELLIAGIDRLEARARVLPEVERVIAGWQRTAAS